MKNDDGRIASRFKGDHTSRSEMLDRARLASALTDPSILPPEGHAKNSKLPEKYTDAGSRGVMNLSGRMLMSLYPPGQPWFAFEAPADLIHNPEIPEPVKNEIKQRFFLRELMIQSILESSHLRSGRRRASGFRSQKRQAIDQIIVTGDCLEKLNDDYRIQVFGREHYVTKRDSSSDVLYHITREQIDPLSLRDNQIEAAGLRKGELENMNAADRLTDIYTMVSWEPQSREWKIEQEVEGHIIPLGENGETASMEPVSPYFSTPFKLAPGADYGRGFIELQIMGELKSANELEERILDFAAMASKSYVVRDQSSVLRDRDFTKPSGSVLIGRVQGGMVQDAAIWKADKINDFQVVNTTAERKLRSISSSMLVEAETQPRGDRVTALQVQRIAMELEGTLGGFYAPIADNQQHPLLHRTIYQLTRDRILPPLPQGLDLDIRAITGLAALSREVEAGRILNLTQVVAQLGPEAMQRIDTGILIDVLARYSSVHEPGLIKSDEQMQQEQQQQIQTQTQQAASEKAVDVIGNAAEQAISPSQEQ